MQANLRVRKRKLQIFLSSTYEDLIDHRLAAMEAILAAGHIPAAMEQFSPGEETALERIKAWIDESDAFILIFGGRYGSIEPVSGKSYVQLEHEYAIEKKKPHFALVVSDAHHEERIKQFGTCVDEREHPAKYKEFKQILTQKLCGFWNDKKDIKIAIFQKLPEWVQRTDLTGWVRGDEATNPDVMNELARLSQENRELRARAAAEVEMFDGLGLDEFVRLLAKQQIPASSSDRFFSFVTGTAPGTATSLLDLFNAASTALVNGASDYGENCLTVMNALAGFGLVSEDARVGSVRRYSLTETGRRFRNHVLSGHVRV